MTRYFGVFASHHHLRPRIIPPSAIPTPELQLDLDLPGAANDGLEVLAQDPREQREDGRLGLAAGGRGEHDGVAAVEDSVDRQLLNRPQRAPPEVVDDRVP